MQRLCSINKRGHHTLCVLIRWHFIQGWRHLFVDVRFLAKARWSIGVLLCTTDMALFFLGGLDFTLKPPYSFAHDMCTIGHLGHFLLDFFVEICAQRDLETYPRSYCGHFWNMSLFGDSRAAWVLFRKWVVSENQSFLNKGAIITPRYRFSFRRAGP